MNGRRSLRPRACLVVAPRRSGEGEPGVGSLLRKEENTMAYRAGRWIFTLGLLATMPSCEALPDPGASAEGGMLEMQELPAPDAVPLEWGTLVAVTESGESGLARLWFQDDSGTVRVAALDLRGQRLWLRATVIRRR